MKKNIVLTLCAVVIAALCFCGIAAAQEQLKDYPYNPGTSKLFTEDEIGAVADLAVKELSDLKVTEIFLVEYAGDPRSLYELDYANKYAEKPFDDCLVILTAFRTPDDVDNMTWAGGEDYMWNWTYVRTDGGEWELNNYGFAEVFIESDQYSVYDMNGGVDVVRYDIGQMEGVNQLNISYTSDENSAANLEYINSLDRGKFDECAVFSAWFMSPKNAYGAWEADTLYNWTWFLGRADKGYWETVTYGN